MSERFIENIANDYYSQSVGQCAYPVDDLERDPVIDKEFDRIIQDAELDDVAADQVNCLMDMCIRFGFMRGFKCAVALMEDD